MFVVCSLDALYDAFWVHVLDDEFVWCLVLTVCVVGCLGGSLLVGLVCGVACNDAYVCLFELYYLRWFLVAVALIYFKCLLRFLRLVTV